MKTITTLAMLLLLASCGNNKGQKIEVKTCLPSSTGEVQEMVCTVEARSPIKICKSENVDCKTDMRTGITKCNVTAPLECTSEFRELADD